MKTLPVRVTLHWIFSTILVMTGIIYAAPAAHAADAQPPPTLALPSSPAFGAFSPWKKMHPSTFDLSIDALGKQCEKAEPTETWLTLEHCRILVAKLEAKQCRVAMVPDGIRLDRLLGRVDGGKGPSKAWAKQEKNTGRLDRALLCDLGGGVHTYWFTGEDTSCNNVAFVYLPTPTAVAPPPTPQGEWVCVQVPAGETLQSVVGHQLEGFVLQNDCCCGEDLVVRSHNFHLGSTLQSSGYTEHCFISQTKKELQK